MSENANLPAEAPQETPAQRQKRRVESFLASMEARKDQISALLTASNIKPEFFVAVARRAMAKSPDLAFCTADSLMQAFINAATDGLLPDGREGVINIYKENKGSDRERWTAQWQPMYQGLLKVAYRSGNFKSIEARVVYQGDEFDFELGDEPFIRHKPNAASVADRKIIAAYMVAKTVNGGTFREVMLKPDLDKVAAVSRAKSGPNKDWPEEMARKAPVRRGWKYLPRTPEMDLVIDHDDDNYDLEALSSADEEAPPQKTIKAGFAPQLTQGADMVAPDLTKELDEVLDGDALPAGEGDAEPAKAAEADFPGDRPGVRTEKPPGNDEAVLTWARDYRTSLPNRSTVKAIMDAWNEAKRKGLTSRLEALNMALFESLVAAREARINEIMGA